ncbi:probable cytochrome P450 6u1 [Drosophila miranda]|uniref:probable cytochrome P450 6u1 n=1 Tax=Drosophila miranda TaxID=7229 RepID=UPI0007E7BAE5|nr:probable cytochrome P450 6u1 [Drosophila miranda]XP_017149865.1 probable cytochrome P450 6u1 [Drosophila miranda]
MDLLHRALLTAVGALSLVYALVKISLGYWKRRGILHEKPKFFWGNIKGVVGGKRHLQDALQVIYAKYKGRAPFVGFFACLKPFVLVLDLELVRHILVTHAGNFTTRGLYSNDGSEPLSGNLLQLDGHKWRALHAQSTGVFTPANINKLLPRLVLISRGVQRSLGKERLQTLNINELVDSYNLDVVASMAFGLSADHTEFRRWTQSYWGKFSLWRAYLALEFPLLAQLLNHKSYAVSAMAYFQKVVLGQLQEQRKRDRQPLQTFLQLYSNMDQPLDDVQIAAQAFGFVLAGLVPLNATLSFCLYELARQPELQDRVRAEIRKTLEQHSGQLTTEGLKELLYTKQVLNETLRLHTPYPFLLRRATKEFELPGSVFVIARGNNVLIPTAAIHRDPAIYEEPLRFDPDRFEAEAKRTRPAMSFLPFGDGLRGCIAAQFVEQELLVGLVTLLQYHRYTPCSKTAIPLEYDNGRLLLMPKTDIHLNVERVDN